MFRAVFLVAPILAVVINHDNDKLWNWLKDESGTDPIDAVLKMGDDAAPETAKSTDTSSSQSTTTTDASTTAKDSSYTDILTSGASAPASDPAQAEVYHPPAAEMNFGSSPSSSRLITIPLDSQFIQGGRHLRGA